MTGLHAAVLAVATALLSWVAVALVRKYASRHLVDHPNARSSHQRPTPRGGGLGLTVVHLAAIVIAPLAALVPFELAVAMLGGGLLVSVVGLMDDHGHVRPLARLTCHVIAFAWALWWLGGLPPVDFGWGPVDLGGAGMALLVLYLAWFLNLFNFMDGIDGIAALQAIFMSLAGAVLACVNGAGAGDTLPMLLLAAATAGFLAWNWPPARIFMGDVGSGYLGFSLGVLALWTVVSGWLTPWVWLILGGAFLADATVTLLRRMVTRQRFAEPHRSHAYQRLSRRWQGHRPVTLAYLGVNVCWLWPLAAVATWWPVAGAACAVVALLPLFLLALRLGAGLPGDLTNSA